MAGTRERWSGRLGFVLATIGSAVGLGSIWKFPYEVGANGGAPFVLCYLAGLALIVLPLMLAEFAIGRRGQGDAVASIEAVAAESRAHGPWALAGVLGILTAFLILSFYSVVAGWALAYALETALAGPPGSDAQAVQARFDALLASPGRMALYHTLFMALTCAIVARGVAGGIERASTVMMPVLAALIALLAIYSMAMGDARATLRFLFAPDLSQLSAKVALEALGLGFFSIGVGMAVMITYAAYAGRDIDLKQVAIASIAGDTAISFLAGFAIFPVVFANGLDPSAGPGLLFVTVPLAFARMPLGTLVSFTFFVLLVVAGLASAMSMLEMAVAWLRRAYGWSRARAALIAAAAAWAAGFATVLSFNWLAGWYPLSSIPAASKATLYDIIDYLTSNVMLPVGGLALAVFAGWVFPERLLRVELRLGDGQAALLRGALRYLAPAGIAAATVGAFLR